MFRNYLIIRNCTPGRFDVLYSLPLKEVYLSCELPTLKALNTSSVPDGVRGRRMDVHESPLDSFQDMYLYIKEKCHEYLENY